MDRIYNIDIIANGSKQSLFSTISFKTKELRDDIFKTIKLLNKNIGISKSSPKLLSTIIESQKALNDTIDKINKIL